MSPSMLSGVTDHGVYTDYAPEYSIPTTPLVAVEHPFLIKNISKAVESLGGVKHVSKLVGEAETQKPARLSLKPGDPFSRSLESCIVPGKNLLLRVEVPKRTGRKRKRGTDEPFRYNTSCSERREDQLLRALRDNPEDYDVSVVGQIERTHRFRDPPDFVWATSTNKFLQRFKNSILTQSLDEIKNFKLDPDAEDGELVPPPVLATMVTPWNYSYRQSVAVKTVQFNGETVTFNSTAHQRLKIMNVKYDVAEVPIPSPDELDATFKMLSQQDQYLVERVRHYFEKRPIWTRRSMRNALRAEGIPHQHIDHHIYAHAAYIFMSGPWRDALIKHGVDPRKDPAMRVYQTISFRTDDIGPTVGGKMATGGRGGRIINRAEAPPPELSHTFDGEKVDTSGKLWQVCDITEPTIAALLATEDIRSECEIQQSGWYHHGTWGKVRAITKAKVRHLMQHGRPMDESKGGIAHLLEVPDQVTEDSVAPLKDKWRRLNEEQRKELDYIRSQIRAGVESEMETSLLREETAESAEMSVENGETDHLVKDHELGEDEDDMDSYKMGEQEAQNESDGKSAD